MSTIDDLLSRRRRGALSEADERRLQVAVSTSREHQLTLLAGEVFDGAGVPQPGDAALVKNIVRQVEGEWSGTFQRVVARRRLSRWVSVPVLVAGVAAASLGGYRALRAPAGNPHAPVLAARERAAELALQAGPTVVEPRAVAAQPVSVPPGSVPPGSVPPGSVQLEASRAVLQQVVLPPTPRENFVVVPAPESLGPPAALAAPAGAGTSPPLALAAPAAVAGAPPAPPARAAAAAPAVATRSWRLPRPRPHIERGAAAPSDLDLAGAAPSLAAPVAARAGGSALEPQPDLESSQALFRRANQLRRSDWDAAASLYERLALRHSESREAGVAEMALGKHALAEGRARQALQWFVAYQRRAGGELAAEALWGQARALESLGENERARELWRGLIEHYPASAYAAAAREQLGP